MMMSSLPRDILRGRVIAFARGSGMDRDVCANHRPAARIAPMTSRRNADQLVFSRRRYSR